MPLFKGKKNIGKNIKTEMSHGKSQKQSVAIAMNVAGKKKAKKMPSMAMVQKSVSKSKGY